MNLPLRTTLIVFYMLGNAVSSFYTILGSFKFLISVLTHFTFDRVIHFQHLVRFPLFLLFIGSISPWSSDRMQRVILIFLYLLRLDLCLTMWSTLEKVQWCSKKKVFFVFVWVKYSVNTFYVHLVYNFS